MSPQTSVQDGENKRYRPKKKTIIGVGLLFFFILGCMALVIANFRAQYASQAILNQQRDVQRTWLDKSLDAIGVWRNELVEQARYISASEMFRLFVIDARQYSGDELEKIADPDALNSHDEGIRSMAEQLTYIQDLLRDFTRRRAWNDARILLPDGRVMAAPQFSAPLSNAQVELARKAGETGHAIFGPIRQGERGLVMDMADPLFEVLGTADPNPVAILLLSVPLDKPLATFLARNGERTETLLPRIVNQDGGHMLMALSAAGRVSLEPVGGEINKLENLPFELRPALDGKGQVYSMGGMPTSLNWLFVLETPAAEVEALINSQKTQIYGLAILASVVIALMAAWIWAGHTSRKHEADAIRYEKLYNTIRNQKLMLDSVNSSFKAGLLLVDEYGRVQMANPAFREICGLKTEIEPGTPLVECLPSQAAVQLMNDMSRLKGMDKPVSVELTIPRPAPAGQHGEERLYRITLYPYSDSESGSKQATGYVATFQDITEFRRKALEERRKAEEERNRQAALITAFVRAVESVDPNLVGHSDKMVGISALLAKELQLDEKQTETLELAAKLSQVGKIYVPRELLTKQGKLTEDELKEIRKAPEYADKILHDLHFDLPVRETVGLIGERVDGSGEPQGLAGEKISLCGRALAVVNAFIAMTSSRAWRKDGGMSIDDAIRALSADAGFDRSIVDALGRLAHADINKVIRRETTNNQESKAG